MSRSADLGCGTGRLLERAAERWPDAHLVGIDPSPQQVAPSFSALLDRAGRELVERAAPKCA